MSEDGVRLLRGAASGRSLVGAALMGTLERSEPTRDRLDWPPTKITASSFHEAWDFGVIY